jgi:hypothetical protein
MRITHWDGGGSDDGFGVGWQRLAITGKNARTAAEKTRVDVGFKGYLRSRRAG